MLFPAIRGKRRRLFDIAGFSALELEPSFPFRLKEAHCRFFRRQLIESHLRWPTIVPSVQMIAVCLTGLLISAFWPVLQAAEVPVSGQSRTLRF